MKINRVKGFSLAEVLTVVFIITILAAIAAPQFSVYAHNNALKSAARDLAGDIQIIRQRAMADGVPYTLNILSNTSYTFTLPPNPLVTKNVTTFYPDITFAQTFPGNQITFLSNGTIKETSWPIIINRTITLTNSRGSTVILAATPPAGRINVTYNMQ